MEKRVIIFLLLSVAIIFGYDYILKELGWLPPPSQNQDASNDGLGPHPEDSRTPPRQSSSEISKTNTEVARQSGEGRPSPRSSDVTLPTSEETLTIDTDLFRAELTNRGGVLRSWELKRYRTASPDQKPVQLVYSGGKFRGPLSIAVADANLDKSIREGLYSLEKDFTRVDASHPVGHVTLRFRDPDKGFSVEKHLTFHHDSYVVDISVKLDGVTQPFDVSLGTNFGIVEWGDGLIGLIGSASMVDTKVEKETPEGELERKGPVQWVALQDK